MRRGTGPVDENGFGRAAHTGAPHLGVEHDRFRHGERCGLVDIDMADAFEMAEDRHAGFLLDAGDEALAAARHDEIDGALEPAKQETDGIAIHGRHHLDGFHGKPRRKEPTLQSSDDGG